MIKVLFLFYIMMLGSNSLLVSKNEIKSSEKHSTEDSTSKTNQKLNTIKTLKEEMTSNGLQCCSAKEIQDLCKQDKILQLFIKTATEEAKEVTIIDFDDKIPQQDITLSCYGNEIYPIQGEQNTFLFTFPGLNKAFLMKMYSKNDGIINIKSFRNNVTKNYDKKIREYVENNQEIPKKDSTSNSNNKLNNIKTLKEEMTDQGFQCCNIKEFKDLCKIYTELELYIETAKAEAKQLTLIDFDATIPQQLFSFNFTKSPAVFPIKDESNKFMIAFPDLKKVIVATIFFKDNPNTNDNEKFLSFCVNTTGKFTDKLQAYQNKIGLIFLFVVGSIVYMGYQYKKNKEVPKAIGANEII